MEYVHCNIKVPLRDFDVSTPKGRTDLYIFIEQKLFTDGVNQFLKEPLLITATSDSESFVELTEVLSRD